MTPQLHYNFDDRLGRLHGYLRIVQHFDLRWYLAEAYFPDGEKYPNPAAHLYFQDSLNESDHMIMALETIMFKKKPISLVVGKVGVLLECDPLGPKITFVDAQGNILVNICLTDLDARLLLSYLKNEPPEVRAFLYQSH